MRLAAGIGVLVLALAAGLTTWLVLPSSSSARAVNRAPFDQAVTNLAALPALHYVSQPRDGSPGWDVRVTSHGEAVGTITVDGEEIPLLIAGGKTFVKPPGGSLPGAPSTAPPALGDRWITGHEITDDPELSPVLRRLLPPLTMAQNLRHAFLDDPDFPAPGAPGTTVGGVPALRLATTAGVLYVAKAPPYRVLALLPSTPWLPFGMAPSAGSGSPSASDEPSAPNGAGNASTAPDGSTGDGSVAWQPRPGTPTYTVVSVRAAAVPVDDTSPGPDPGSDADPNAITDPETDGGAMTPIGPDDLPDLYNDLEDNTRQLSNAVDADIQFNLDGNATLDCTAGGCLVTANVTSNVTAGAGSTITGGQVNAELAATVEIQGEPAGGCTSTGTLPVNGNGSISCEDGPAGAVWQSAVETAQAEAQEEANAEAEACQCDTQVPWQVEALGSAVVTATAQVDVEQQIQQEDDEKNASNCLGNPGAAPAAYVRPAAFPRDTNPVPPGAQDPEKPCKPIPDATRLDDEEQATAGRLINDPKYTGGRLRQADDPAYDYQDQYNRYYDAIGTPTGFRSPRFDMNTFLGQLNRHVALKQGNNFTVLDLTGADSQQIDQIFEYIDSQPLSWQKKLFIEGD